MGLTSDSINEAVDLEAGAAEEVEAAVAESERDNSPFWISMLLEAAQTERDSLEAMEKSLEMLNLSLTQRRRTIDQQEEILRDLSNSLIQERTQKKCHEEINRVTQANKNDKRNTLRKATKIAVSPPKKPKAAHGRP